MGEACKALILFALFSQAAWGAAPVPASPPADPLQDRLRIIMADPAAHKAAVEAGRKSSFFCANCHGEDGNSRQPDVPNLAGQNPSYLLEQIRKFASGERKDAFMEGMIKVLKDEQRMQIAVYYASTAAAPARTDPAQAARGRELFGRMCVRCHGEQARGNEMIPRLAGQKLSYLQTTIARYRDKTGVRNNPFMSIATASLKNDEIVAIANYLAQLP